MDCWAEGVASTQSVSEQPVGAEPSAHQAALLPDAGIRKVRISKPLLQLTLTPFPRHLKGYFPGFIQLLWLLLVGP